MQAGSDQPSARTTVNGLQFKEAIGINKSLFTLRQVITALTENAARSHHCRKDSLDGSSQQKMLAQYVPYRESKLTTILKPSLGGNSYTLMIACLAPIDLYCDENISTLNYATRTSKINNAPLINTDPKSKKIADQQSELDKLKAELKRATDQVRFLMQNCICG